MAMMKEIDFKDIANAKIASRIKQVLILAVIILIGIMISIATQAQPPKHFKAKYACSELNKKRNRTENKKVVQVSTRKPKYKPMAEVDPPKSYRTAQADKAVTRKKL
jgi:hypothetical protein